VIYFTLETDYYDRKRIHNLKYFTRVEQQGKSFGRFKRSGMMMGIGQPWHGWPEN
jgi:hypothetical protein